MLFGVQALVNLAVAMAMLPTKGLTLPFVSYGGSSLLVSAAAMGILLNISRSRELHANVACRRSPRPKRARWSSPRRASRPSAAAEGRRA